LSFTASLMDEGWARPLFTYPLCWGYFADKVIGSRTNDIDPWCQGIRSPCFHLFGPYFIGVWYLALAIGMETAGNLGESIDRIAAENSMSYFFWILTLIPVAVGVVSIVCQPFIKKLMHDVK
jgi:dipeptide/tripeptide permease